MKGDDFPASMDGADMRAARAHLGALWRLGRPATMTELGRVLGLEGRDVGASVRDWERGKSPIRGPTRIAIRALLDGWRPGELESYLRRAGDQDE